MFTNGYDRGLLTIPTKTLSMELLMRVLHAVTTSYKNEAKEELERWYIRLFNALDVVRIAEKD